MTPERFQKVGELYDRATELELDQREAYLTAVCGGDEELRREVESLLAAHDSAVGFIDQPAVEIAAPLIANHPWPITGPNTRSIEGKKIGTYLVLSLLGKGGMGEVYLANDLKLGRKVALKILPKQSTQDRKSTRLNSSHLGISYAVFC